jgi:hypothetical protein
MAQGVILGPFACVAQNLGQRRPHAVGFPIRKEDKPSGFSLANKAFNRCIFKKVNRIK